MTLPSTLPPPASLSNDDLKTEAEMLTILISETRHLGQHACSPTRRSASGRVEQKLQLLLDQITAIIGPQ